MLPKENRLRSREDFDRVFHSGKALFLGEILCLVTEGQEKATRIGVAFKGKGFPRASMRHFYKRKALAALRPLLPELPKGHDIVILFQKPFAQATFVFFEEKMKALREHLKAKKKI